MRWGSAHARIALGTEATNLKNACTRGYTCGHFREFTNPGHLTLR